MMITNHMSVCIVQKVYRKKCNQILTFFSEDSWYKHNVG